ncbi:hypothetical protein C2E25_07985 [Geothermobacter hydrogeniphilus]|uniref:Uncharacterized protein n=2 Tax=Geothermobacter hydrogeniphilus TaxID=1969733 RepID=A0A2K2HAU8_9BACT|nr:hypothetical protein C2E25_07985 [Geothermobacter hydrogeniphilus]
MSYHVELDAMNQITAKTMGVNAITLPSETIFATKLKVLTLWGIPRLVQPGGLNMDADYLMQVAKARDGNTDTVKQYMLSSGMTSSVLEHKVPEELFSTPDNPVEGISTVKALKIANDRGIPIYTVNQANITTVLPKLQVGQQVKTDIQNAVNAGKVVTVSQSNISFNGWVGCGYIITNPETGAGAYMISGGLSGAVFTWVVVAFWVIALLLFCILPVPMVFVAGALGVMAAYGILFAQVCAVMVGVLTGAGIGIFFSDNFKEVLLSGLQDFMFALLTGGLVLSGFLGTIAGIIIFILWLLSYHDIFSVTNIKNNRKIYCQIFT